MPTGEHLGAGMRDEIREAVRAEVEPFRKTLDRIDRAVSGSPDDPTRPGIMVRLDRLEQEAVQRKEGAKRTRFWLGVAVTGAVGSLAEAARSFFSHLGAGK